MTRLAAELLARGIDPGTEPVRPAPHRRATDPPDLSWVSQYGYRQLREFQAMHARPLLGA